MTHSINKKYHINEVVNHEKYIDKAVFKIAMFWYYHYIY